MKLDPEELVVTSFGTADEPTALPGQGTNDPTPMTRCFWCPPASGDCPLTEPVIVTE